MMSKGQESIDYSTVAFVPQQLLPPPSHKPWEGERRLMLAILEEAIQSYRRTEGRRAWRSREDREPERWLFTDDPTWTFSFVNICSTLGLDPRAIRGALSQHQPTCRSPYAKRIARG